MLWAAGALAHLRWLLDLATSLCAEYELRTFLRIGEHKIHACSAHLARIRMTVDGLTHADLPEQISPGDWLTWVTDVIQGGKAACMKIVKAVATCNPPDGCLFGVLDIDPNPRWGPKLAPEAHAEAKRALTRRCAVTSDLDLVASYRLYSAKKAKSDFAFTWAGAATPPPPARRRGPSTGPTARRSRSPSSARPNPRAAPRRSARRPTSRRRRRRDRRVRCACVCVRVRVFASVSG